ncbi:helix-turn-helix domain-containing protein [Streptomyces sp. NBC_00343]|uniref:helix-turn-helix domain-containing protein n=1 Tax=Streptomyces sp. NBC_00343 TaxID=2975719 RepID=UPI002E2A591A|nr:helix-turn-helix domain-containing protein [Streptomyces sp. NBC_00343]
MVRPVDDSDRAAVKRLHAAGKSRNDIAREIRRSPSTVSKIAAAFEPPLTFDRAAEVAAATAARTADLADRRASLAVALHNDAERLRAQLWQPTVYGEFAGKDGKWQQVHLDQPRFADQRQIIGATATAIQQSLRLAPVEGGEGAEQVRSMLGALGDALTQAAGDPDPGEAADGG